MLSSGAAKVHNQNGRIKSIVLLRTEASLVRIGNLRRMGAHVASALMITHRSGGDTIRAASTSKLSSKVSGVGKLSAVERPRLLPPSCGSIGVFRRHLPVRNEICKYPQDAHVILERLGLSLKRLMQSQGAVGIRWQNSWERLRSFRQKRFANFGLERVSFADRAQPFTPQGL